MIDYLEVLFTKCLYNVDNRFIRLQGAYFYAGLSGLDRAQEFLACVHSWTTSISQL